MLLNAEQWQRLHKTVKETLPWFMGKGLFYGRIGILQKIASSSPHDLYQIRKPEDWNAFTGGFPDPLPLGLVLNFTNGTRSLDWPYSPGSTQQLEVKEKLSEALRDRVSRQVKWSTNRYIWPESYTLDFDPDAFGGIVNVFTDKTERWDGYGIMCGEDSYIPCSISF